MGLSQHGIKSSKDRLTFTRDDVIFKDTLVVDKSLTAEGNVIISGDLTVSNGTINPLNIAAQVAYIMLEIPDLGVSGNTYFTLPQGGFLKRFWSVVDGTTSSGIPLTLQVSNGAWFRSLQIANGAVKGEVDSSLDTEENWLEFGLPAGASAYVDCDGLDANNNKAYLTIEFTLGVV